MMKTKYKRKRIEQRYGLHNEFTIKVTEFETDKCKKVKAEREYKAFNIVLNQGLQKIEDHMKANLSLNNGKYHMATIARNTEQSSTDPAGYSFGGAIHYGSGSTTPAVTNTHLNVFEGSKWADYESKGIDWANRYSYYEQKITILPSEEVGTVFREVGLASHTINTYLSTHALIVDSEGSVIYFTKTSSMQIVIYSKLYLILNTSAYTNTDWVNGGNNALLYAFKENRAWADSYVVGIYSTSYLKAKWYLLTGTDDTAIDSANDNAVETQLAISDALQPTAKAGGYGAEVTHRFATDESNGKIKEIGLKMWTSYPFGTDTTLSVFRSIMPVTGVWAKTQFTDEEIGVGDGSEDTFYLDQTDEESETWVWNEINETNPTIKVDGVTKTAGTHFNYTDSSGAVVFTAGNIPATDEVITATWSVPYIAKSNDYVLDIDIAIVFTEGTVPS